MSRIWVLKVGHKFEPASGIKIFVQNCILCYKKRQSWREPGDVYHFRFGQMHLTKSNPNPSCSTLVQPASPPS